MIKYLSTAGFAQHLGLATGTIETYDRQKKLPVPNARIGRIKGYLIPTIDEWDDRRPGVRPDAEHADWYVMVHSTIVYLPIPEFAARIGVHKGTLNRYKLPPVDAAIGSYVDGEYHAFYKGYLPQTIDDWEARRPGRGQVPRGAEDWNLPPELQQRNRVQ